MVRIKSLGIRTHIVVRDGPSRDVPLPEYIGSSTLDPVPCDDEQDDDDEPLGMFIEQTSPSTEESSTPSASQDTNADHRRGSEPPNFRYPRTLSGKVPRVHSVDLGVENLALGDQNIASQSDEGNADLSGVPPADDMDVVNSIESSTANESGNPRNISTEANGQNLFSNGQQDTIFIRRFIQSLDNQSFAVQTTFTSDFKYLPKPNGPHAIKIEVIFDGVEKATALARTCEMMKKFNFDRRAYFPVLFEVIRRKEDGAWVVKQPYFGELIFAEEREQDVGRTGVGTIRIKLFIANLVRKPFKPKPRTVGISNEIAARAAATRARRQAEKEGREEGPDPAFPDRVDREPDQVISAVTQLAKRKELLTHATHLRDTKHLGHRCPLPEPDPLEDLEHPGAKGKRRKRARASAQEQPKTKNVWTPEKEPFLVVDYRYRQRDMLATFELKDYGDLRGRAAEYL